MENRRSFGAAVALFEIELGNSLVSASIGFSSDGTSGRDRASPGVNLL